MFSFLSSGNSNPSISNSLITVVQEAVNKVTAQGLVTTVRGPVEVGVSLTGILYLKKIVSAQEENDIIDAVTLNVTDYINNLDIAEEFIINEVLERAMSTSDTIKTVGTYIKPFESIYIYRPSRLEDNKVRSTLITDFTPKSDERVITENAFAWTVPILFSIG